ncbi:MAG: hypothetical protein EOO28_17010 [Comamonadaceae bacterium]|nr:MAG: hypothetical protein EOO28_17010 [Comamonadaceae bacterium]
MSTPQLPLSDDPEKMALLETTLDSISQGVFMIGADGRLVMWNHRIEELLNLPRELLESRPNLQEMVNFQFGRGDFGTDAYLVEQDARDYVTTGGKGTPPGRYLRNTADGRVLEVQTQTLASGGMVRTFADVTDYVRAQEEIRRLNNQLEDRVRQRTTELEGANRELDAFSYSIAHDLRQPLSSIDGFSTMLAALLRADEGTPARHYVERIRAGVRQMSALTDGLLSLAYLSRKTLHWQACDIGEMASQVLADLAAKQPERKVNVEIQPGMHCTCERMLMRQVIENLLGNAWKFTVRNPEPLIRLGRMKGDDGGWIYFVSDNGVGFDMAYAGKLFGTFQRLHSPNDFSGLGIGLAIAHRIIERHGGRIWAKANPNQGATFFFTLGQEES